MVRHTHTIEPTPRIENNTCVVQSLPTLATSSQQSDFQFTWITSPMRPATAMHRPSVSSTHWCGRAFKNHGQTAVWITDTNIKHQLSSARMQCSTLMGWSCLKGEVHDYYKAWFVEFEALSRMVKVRGSCDKPFKRYLRLKNLLLWAPSGHKFVTSLSYEKLSMCADSSHFTRGPCTLRSQRSSMSSDTRSECSSFRKFSRATGLMTWTVTEVKTSRGHLTWEERSVHHGCSAFASATWCVWSLAWSGRNGAASR